MKRISLVITLICTFYYMSFGQISFTLNEEVLSDLEVSSGAPMAIADMNGDGLDDLISLDRSRDLYISFQNADRSFNVLDFPTVGSSNWGMTVGDTDNDGRSEIFTGGAYDRVRLISYEDNGNLQTDFMDGPSIFVQAVSFFDIDNDGSLDAIACHDDGPNGVYMNDGAGELAHIGEELPFEKFSGEEDNSGNYGNVWTDVNGDGLMDYYIAKCRQGVSDVTDNRRVNQLWINQGDGTFTESAEEFGLDIGLQSWTAEFQDIDNDGDMDCLITNHDGPTQLLENINNTSFDDITASCGITVEGLPIQAIMRDFDNDGFVDALITGNDNRLFRNNGDKTFTLISNTESSFIGGENSFACGDLNHDGFLDLMIGYGTGFNGPSSELDKLWINNTNNNNWLAVELEGNQTNIGGVGARVEIFGDWGIMVREVRAGESYGISHSLTQYFGVGTSTAVDSVVVHWPSGLVDRFQDISPNQFIKIKEGLCITPPSNIAANGPTTFCTGESVMLSAAAGYSYLWNTGQQTQSIVVDAEGLYSVQIFDGSDCNSTSVAINVIIDPEESFAIIPQGDLSICSGESISIENSLMADVSWSNGATGSTVSISQSGFISATAAGTCETISSNVLDVTVISAPQEPTNLNYAFDFEQLTLSADGDFVSWFDENFALLGTGNELILEGVSSSMTVYANNTGDNVGSTISGGETDHTGASDYNSDGFNGSLVFDVYKSMNLISVAVDTDMPGIRTIVLRNDLGETVYEKSIDVPLGKSDLQLGFNIEPGLGYSLATDDTQNILSLGTQSPRFKRSSVDFGSILNFPYPFGDLMTLQTTNFGDNFYYYFYDWKVALQSKTCSSDFVSLNIQPSSALSIDQNTDITIAPNPSEGFFNIAYKGAESFDIRVLSLNGSEYLNTKDLRDRHAINLSQFAAGVYILEMRIEGNIYFSKMVKL